MDSLGYSFFGLFVSLAVVSTSIACNSSTAVVKVPVNNSEKPKSTTGAVAQKNEIEFQDLPEGAQAAAKVRLDKFFAKAPSGNRITCLKYVGTKTWRFNGTGDEVYGDLVHGGDYDWPYVRVNGLNLYARKKELTKADELNGWTEKYLIQIRAKAIGQVDTSGKTRRWYDASKGLNFQQMFVLKNKSGDWSTQTYFGSFWKKPNEEFDISKL